MTDRGSGASRSTRAPAAVPALALVLLAGLGLRLIIAYVLLPGSGFSTDLASFTSWAMTLADAGPGAFYESAGFADYPPGYLYVLWLVGLLSHLFAGPEGAGALAADLIKIPPILADVAVGALLWDTLRAWLPDRRGARLGVVAAALYLFNPVTWYDSAVWGQVDAVGALVMLAGVRALVAGWSEGAALLTVVAGVVKPQFGIVMAPLVGAVLLHRHVLAPGSGPRPSWMPARVATWFAEEQGIWRLVSSAAVALFALVVVLVPFGLSLPGFVQLMAQTAGGYPFLSVNAYNPWALVAAPVNGRSLADGGGWSPDVAGTNPYGQTFGPEDVALVAGLPGVTIGTALLLIGFIAGVVQLLRSPERRSIVLVAVYLSLAFFVLPTRVHERYLFPVFAFLPLVAVLDRRWLVAGVALAAASFVNLHGVLTTPLYATPNVASLPLGDEFRSPLWITLSAVAHLAVFAFALASLRALFDPLRNRLAPSRRGRVRDGDATQPALPLVAEPAVHQPVAGESVEVSRVPSAAGERTGSALPEAGAATRAKGAAAAPAASPGRAAARPDAVAHAPWWTEEVPIRAHRPKAAKGGVVPTSGVAATLVPAFPAAHRLAPLRRLLAAPPLRRDRTAGLFAEGGGRFGRLDLFLVAVLVVAALLVRTWRLAEPYGMHFDEVYHARTATEFLQHWRYGLRHDIYEFTHPHLAKYAIAVGIAAAGNNRVTAESSIDRPVADALVERRWSDTRGTGGDRLWIAGEPGVRAWSLPDRTPLGEVPGTPGTVALALDADAHALYGADASGAAWSASTVGDTQPRPVGALGGMPLDIAVSGSRLLAVLDDGRVASLDTSTGERVEVEMPGATALVPLDGFDRLVADPADVPDVAAAASQLAEILGDDADRIEGVLGDGDGTVTVVDRVDSDERDDIDRAIANGDLPGVRMERQGTVAVAFARGVGVRETATLDEAAHVQLGDPATGLALVEDVGEPTLYVATGSAVAFVEVPDDASPTSRGTLEMPGAVRDVRFNESTQLVHVLGTAPDGAGETVYVIEPHGNAVFADARLPFSPVAWTIDEQPDFPSADRQELLALASDGRVAVVDAGSNAFGWRIPGVLAGIAMTALLYVLARILFARRGVALLAAAVALLDGMFFAQSRIAMNDSYVALFIVAAYTVFAAIYVGRWRGASALLVGIPLVGLMLGLGLAAKWVSAYALGGIVLLILLRSALGRLIALAGMVAATGALGWLAIVPADVPQPQLNFLFLFLMIALTILLAAAMVARPIRMSLDEARFAVGAPAVVGALLGAVGILLGPRLAEDGGITTRTFLAPAVLLLVLSAIVYAAQWLPGRAGIGPLADRARAEGSGALPDPAASPPAGWMRPGWRLGIPWLFALACLTAIPLAVYVASYVPWAALGNRFVEGFPAGNTGQLFIDLQRSMYDYHNELRATHAASSPWWAWLLDLKPVWFYSEGLGSGTTGLIYDAGNVVLFWLSAAALPWAAWQAWRRRSLALGLVVLAFACQWLPWARIDRATFQYHVYTSLPFAFLVLAYFLADLWHGPSRRTWLYARVAAAVALLGPALLWLGRAPLCAVAGVERVNANSEACGAVQGQIVLTDRLVATLVIIGVGIAALVWQVRTRSRDAREREDAAAHGVTTTASSADTLLGGVWMAATIALTAFAVVLVQTRFAGATLWAVTVGAVGPYVLAAVALLPLLLLAWAALGARDSRRYVVSALVAAAVWFVVFYPHISGVPMPNPYGQAYLGFLPTWNYDFQFAVNTDPAVEDARLIGPESLLLGGGVALLAGVVMYAVWSWRVELAARRARSVPTEPSAPD